MSVAAGGNGPPAVVVGLDCITGLQTARILSRAGIPVVGVAADRGHFACRTRSCRSVHQGATSGPGLVQGLEQLAAGLDARAVLFPCTDASVYTISEHRARLDRHYHVRLAPHEVVHTLMDKAAFTGFAERHALPVPRTRTVRTRAELIRAGSELAFPVVVKPTVKTATWTNHTRAKAFEVHDEQALTALYDRVSGWTDELIVQEWVVGGEDALYSFNGYFGDDGQPLATFIARKLRQWPPRTGTSASGEECRNDTVLDLAIELFGAAGYRGLAYLEVKRDARTGRHVIIEPNVGRPTGRSAIAEAGGVPLLATVYADALGRTLPEPRTQTYGRAKWVYLRHDVQAGIHAWRHRRLGFLGWIRSLSGHRGYAVWSLRDPVPFVMDLVRTAGKLLGRREGRSAPVPRPPTRRSLRPGFGKDGVR